MQGGDPYFASAVSRSVALLSADEMFFMHLGYQAYVCVPHIE